MKTLPHLLNNLATIAKHKTALRDHWSTLTYGDLSAKSRKIAAGLLAQGIEKGDRVGLWLPNIAAYMEFFFACAEIGAIVVSVNTKFKSYEMADIVSRSGCKMLVLWPDFKNIPFLDILSEIPKGALDGLQSVVLYSESNTTHPALPACLDDKKVINFDDLYKESTLNAPAIEEEDGLVIFTTSGTTGKPKFVLHSQKSITQHACEVAKYFGYSDKSCRLLQALPLCGTFGLAQAIAGLAAMAEVHCLSIFNPQKAAQIIRDFKITDMNGSDEMFAMLLDETEEQIPFPYLKQGGFAAFNPALGDLVPQAEKRGIRLAGLWGMSEVQALFALQDPQAPIEDRSRAGGYLTSPSAQVRIVDPDNGRELEYGDAGEIEIRSPSQMSEYFQNPEATDKNITADGFIKTGDLGYQVSERQFIFLSRMGDVLRLGGYLTDPIEIEACLQEYPGVEQAQVVGITTTKGTKAFAFIKMMPDADVNLTAVMDYCKSNLAGYKIPAHLESVSSFPMTESANGLKIQRGKLREDATRIWQQH